MTGSILAAQGMARADAAADSAWKEEALAVGRELVKWRATLTAEDILTRVTGATHEHRAMGSIMVKLKREGLIEPTDRYVPARKPESHCCPKRVWRSKVFGA